MILRRGLYDFHFHFSGIGKIPYHCFCLPLVFGQIQFNQLPHIVQPYEFDGFPAVFEGLLPEWTLFSFLVGNEDMHLKNFSLITRNEKVAMSPAYDFLNTTIALKNAKEELALPLNGKKSNLTRRDLVDYFARERLGIKEAVLSDVGLRFTKALPVWRKLLDRSFLSEDAKKHYALVLDERVKRMQL